MARFVQIDPKDFPADRDAKRGRVYYPLIKEFMETGFPVGRLDRTGLKQSPYQLYAGLTHHIKAHQLPIKVVTRGGEIHMIRLDVDAEGNIDPNWKPEVPVVPDLSEVQEISADTVTNRFEIETDSLK